MAEHFPLKPGLTLEYSIRSAQGEGRIVFNVLTTAKEGNVVRAQCRRTTSWEGEDRHYDYEVREDSTGVFSGKTKEFPLPLAVGLDWGAPPRNYRVAALDAEVSVPGGTFKNCLRITYLIAGGDAGSGERFYAPGVGYVKEVNAEEGEPFEVKLLRWSAPQPS